MTTSSHILYVLLMKATDTFNMLVIDYDITCYINPEEYCNGGVPGAKWQPVSPYHRIMFPPRLRCYSVALARLGFWTNESRAVYGTIGVWERK
jgi:hypothetical protein